MALTRADMARIARAEYMRAYRATPEGREKTKAAQNAYWERKYKTMRQNAQPDAERSKRP